MSSLKKYLIHPAVFLLGLLSLAQAETPVSEYVTTNPVTTIPTGEPEVQTVGQHGFILTRNNIIQEGLLEDRGENIYVQMKEKGGILVSKLDILFIGKTRHDIFVFRQRQISPDSLSELVRLADWASRNQLTAEGIDLLKNLLTTEIDSSARNIIEEKIEQLTYSEKIRQETIKKMAEKDQNDSLIQVNSSEKQDELENWVRNFPFTVQERFISKIHPVLQKRCATADCHGENSGLSGYYLKKSSRGVALRPTILYNMRETFDWIDFKNPAQSELLHHPAIYDENRNQVYPFGDDRSSEKDYNLFTKWVQELPDKIPNYVHQPGRDRNSDGIQTPSFSRYSSIRQASQISKTNSAAMSTPTASGMGPTSDITDTVFTENVILPQNAAQNEPASAGVIQVGSAPPDSPYHFADPNSPEEQRKRGNILKQNNYRDDYDPMIFNHRYHH